MGEPAAWGELRGDFLDRLAAVMRVQGLVQTELATRLGVTQAAVSGWFAKGSFPGEAILRMPAALGVNGHWLLTGEGPMTELPEGDPGYVAGIRMLADAVAALAGDLVAKASAVTDAEAIAAVRAAKAAERDPPARRSRRSS